MIGYSISVYTYLSVARCLFKATIVTIIQSRSPCSLASRDTLLRDTVLSQNGAMETLVVAATITIHIAVSHTFVTWIIFGTRVVAKPGCLLFGSVTVVHSYNTKRIGRNPISYGVSAATIQKTNRVQQSITTCAKLGQWSADVVPSDLPGSPLP